MNMGLIDLAGQRFGRLTVIERAENYIQPNGTHKTQYLGRYNNKSEAEQARIDAEQKYFGEYSYENSMKIAEQNEMRKE